METRNFGLLQPLSSLCQQWWVASFLSRRPSLLSLSPRPFNSSFPSLSSRYQLLRFSLVREFFFLCFSLLLLVFLSRGREKARIFSTTMLESKRFDFSIFRGEERKNESFRGIELSFKTRLLEKKKVVKRRSEYSRWEARRFRDFFGNFFLTP